jgi:16S rRNA G966 N2-methylase RsmD
MSSTKRGGVRNRHDTYPTPSWAVRRIIEALTPRGGRWLEPCAGNGAIIRAIGALPRGPVMSWTAVEIRKQPISLIKKSLSSSHDVVVCGDFLADSPHPDWPKQFDMAITNPPFSLAMPFIEKCRTISRHTVMLLRLNFLASEERSAFMQATRPDVYVLPNRPSFVRNGKVDSIEYAWYHWHENSTGIVRILPVTPLAERKRG